MIKLKKGHRFNPNIMEELIRLNKVIKIST